MELLQLKYFKTVAEIGKIGTKHIHFQAGTGNGHGAV